MKFGLLFAVCLCACSNDPVAETSDTGSTADTSELDSVADTGELDSVANTDTSDTIRDSVSETTPDAEPMADAMADGDAVSDVAATCSSALPVVDAIAMCDGKTHPLPFGLVRGDSQFTFYLDEGCGLVLAVNAPAADSVTCSGGATATFVGGTTGWLVRGIPDGKDVACVRNVAPDGGSPTAYRVDVMHDAGSSDLRLLGCTSLG